MPNKARAAYPSPEKPGGEGCRVNSISEQASATIPKNKKNLSLSGRGFAQNLIETKLEFCQLLANQNWKVKPPLARQFVPRFPPQTSAPPRK